MPPRRRAAAAAAAVAAAALPPPEAEVDPGMSQPTKRYKPTAASNAQAIATLGEQMSGVDDRLANITNLLSVLAAGTQPTAAQPPVTSQHMTADRPPISNLGQLSGQPPVSAAHAAGAGLPNAPCPPGLLPQQAGAQQVPFTDTQGNGTQAPGVFTAGTHANPLAANLRPGTTAGLQPALPQLGAGLQPQTIPGTTAGEAETARIPQMGFAAAGGTTPNPYATRTRHVTTGHLPHQAPAGAWAGPTDRGLPQHAATTTYMSAAEYQHPWDQPTTLQDLENDVGLTRRVAHALQAVATPFTAVNAGKHAQFPHQVVDRGSKKQKTVLGELTLPEYLWGFIQLIKAKNQGDESVPYMYAHLEKVTEDTKSYDWENVRTWSEEILTRISKGWLAWSNTYEIDRLQSQFSHKPSQNTAKPDVSQRGESNYRMSDSVRKAKPGPPCKSYQFGTCSHAADHVNNGYRQLHVCAYCLNNKCELHPHSQSECKTKKFNDSRRGNKESGFGPNKTDK